MQSFMCKAMWIVTMLDALDTRKSMTGYIFIVYGGAVSLKSSLQKVVALSTTEAEYIASTKAIKEAL